MIQQMPQAGILGGIPAPQRPPQGAPGQQMPSGAPQTVPQNPQLAAAIDLVDDDIEHLGGC
jgi:hypothetical protein